MGSHPPRQFKRLARQHPHRLNFQAMPEASKGISDQATAHVPVPPSGAGKRRGEFLPTLRQPALPQARDNTETLATMKIPAVMPEPAPQYDEIVIPPMLSLKPRGLLRPRARQIQSLQPEQAQNGYLLPKISPEQVEHLQTAH